MKHSEATHLKIPAVFSAADATQPFRFSRTTEEMRLALHKVPYPRESGMTRVDEALRQTEDICGQFVSAANAINVAVDYMACLLAVPRFKVSPWTKVFMEMHAWLPYCVSAIGAGTQILVNRDYKPLGQKTKDWAKYEEFEHLHCHLSDEHLKAVSPRPQSLGFLYNDGCTPWGSRKNAEVYLERLHLLQSALKA